MGTINTQIDDLFKTWRKKHPNGFVPDGIVGEDEWTKTKPNGKILFLAKEPHGEPKDLRSEDPWKRLCFWAYGLQRANQYSVPRFSDAEEWYAQQIKEKYPQVTYAFVNLKKSPGGAHSDEPAIQTAVKEDAKEIEQELGYIGAHIVVCCGTFQFAQMLPNNISLTANAWGWCKIKDTIWIDYCHPSAPYSYRMTYYGILGVYQDYLKISGGVNS
jgi:hypothetical protein